MIILNKREEKLLQCLAFIGMILTVASETVKIPMKIFQQSKIGKKLYRNKDKYIGNNKEIIELNKNELI